MLELETVKLKSGHMARPKGACGNMGWFPIPWTGCTAKTHAKALAKFMQVHDGSINELERA